MKLKYVIFKHGKLAFPVFFPEHVAHSAIRMEAGVPINLDPKAVYVVKLPRNGGKPDDPAPQPPVLKEVVFANVISAGFFYLGDEGVVVEDRKSTSLDIGPGPHDKLLLELALSGAGTAMFIIDENNQPLFA